MDTYNKTILKNGLRILTVPAKNSNSVTFAVYVKAGSRFEKDNENGLAHFLEHMAFKGSPKYKTQLDVAKTVEGIGGVWNAGTSEEYIIYFIKAEAKHLPLLIDVLSEMILRPNLRNEDIEGEKGVICEEINMYEDDPKDKVVLLSNKITFSGNPLSRNVAGTKSLVKGFNRKDFVSYREQFFVPKNMVLCVSGNFDESVLKEMSSLWPMELKEPNRFYEKYKNVQEAPQVKVEDRKTEQTHFILSFKSYSNDNPKQFAAKLLSVILGAGIGSRLFQEIRTKRGLAYYIFSFSEPYMDTGVFYVKAGVTNEKLNDAILATIKEISKIKSGDVKENELEKAKNFLTGHLSLALEDNAQLNEFYALQELLSSKVLTYSEYIKKIREVTLDDIKRVANEIFIPKNSNLAMIGPQEEKGLADALSRI